MSQIFRSFEENSQLYLTKRIGKSGRNAFSAVGSLFSDRLLAYTSGLANDTRANGSKKVKILAAGQIWYFNAFGAVQDSLRPLPTPRCLLSKLFGSWDGLVVTNGAGMQPDWVAGMCMAFRAGVFEQLGGFDERYYLYYEDVDLCCRLWLAGFSVQVEPEASIIHDGQRASRRDLQHLRWHLTSIGRFFCSDVYFRATALHRARR